MASESRNGRNRYCSSSAWSTRLYPSRGRKKRIHGTFGSCAATTNVIVQRLRGHTAAITRPAESTSDLDPIDELLRSLNKGKRLQIGPLATSAPFSRPFSNPNSLSLSHPLQALLFPGVIAGFPTCTAGVSLSSRVIHIHVNSKATDSVVPLSEQTQFAL